MGQVTCGAHGTWLQAPKTLQYNPAENALLITSDVEGGLFELYIIPKESARGDTAPVSVPERSQCQSHLI
jgi:hypothetical protein